MIAKIKVCKTYHQEQWVVGKNQDASISLAEPRPLGRGPERLATMPVWVYVSSHCSSHVVDVVLVYPYWLRKETLYIEPGRAKCDVARPNQGRV